MLFAIVWQSAVISCNSDNHFIYRRYRLIAVCDVKCNCSEVGILVSELLLSKAHISCSYSSLGSLSSSIKTEVILCIQWVTDFNIVSFDTMLLAIIWQCALMACNSNRYIERRDLEDSWLVLDCVVIKGLCSRCCDHIIAYVFTLFTCHTQVKQFSYCFLSISVLHSCYS